nr:hypothetical protein CFP56_33615 [Quercus suber]
MEAVEGMLNVTPRSDHAADDHQTEGQKSHWRDTAAEPQHLAVGDQDDGQILEDGVDGDAEVLQSLGGCVDHADEEKCDGSPFPGLFGVEITVGDDTHGLAVHVEICPAEHILVGEGHQDTAEAVAEDGEHRVVGEGIGIIGRHVGRRGGRQGRRSAVGGGGGGGGTKVVAWVALFEFDGVLVVVLALAGHERGARRRAQTGTTAKSVEHAGDHRSDSCSLYSSATNGSGDLQAPVCPAAGRRRPVAVSDAVSQGWPGAKDSMCLLRHEFCMVAHDQIALAIGQPTHRLRRQTASYLKFYRPSSLSDSMPRPEEKRPASLSSSVAPPNHFSARHPAPQPAIDASASTFSHSSSQPTSPQSQPHRDLPTSVSHFRWRRRKKTYQIDPHDKHHCSSPP